MTLEEYSYIAEIIGVVLVIASIFYVARQLKQNTTMVQAQISQSRAESAMSDSQSLYNSDYLPEILVTMRKGGQLTDVQNERLDHWFRSLNRNFENQLLQYREGNLSKETKRSIQWGIRNLIAEHEALRELWKSSRQIYSDDYINLVDSVIAEYLDHEDVE